MERVQLIINTFTKLLKLEHHRSFLESCNAVNVVPVGLRIKKSSSCIGEESQELGKSWRSILSVAESQLLTLLILHYRECLREAEEGAYGILRRERPQLTREEMEHVRERLTMIHQSLLEKRRK